MDMLVVNTSIGFEPASWSGMWQKHVWSIPQHGPAPTRCHNGLMEASECAEDAMSALCGEHLQRTR